MPTRIKDKPSLRDPHCGNLVNPRKAVRMIWQGKDYVFCCDECRRQFEADPPWKAGF